MLPPDARTLSGDVNSPQHLAELRLSSAGLTLPAPGDRFAPSAVETSHLLLLSLQGRVACFHAGLGWHLEASHFAWLAPTAALTLRSASLRAGEMLVWNFRPSVLPDAFHPLLPVPGRAPAHGPAPLTPSMQSLVLALRGCPVAPSR